jgi:hypothetical protein
MKGQWPMRSGVTLPRQPEFSLSSFDESINEAFRQRLIDSELERSFGC